MPELIAAARKVGVPLDGHTLGMIGEAYAAELLDLELMPNSTEGHDARTRDGQTVEIKATTRSSIALRPGRHLPELLAVITLDSSLKPTVVYLGSADPVWTIAGKLQRNGQQVVSISALQRLSDRLRERRRPTTG